MNQDEFAREELRLGHAIQTAVAYEMQLPGRSPDTEPKHLRVGVNMAMCQHAALTKLLIDKGIIQAEDYYDSQIELLENELRMYEEHHPGIKFS